MPPGYLQIAGGYYMIQGGSCGSALIWTKSECEAAATALDLSDQTAQDYTSSLYYHPYYADTNSVVPPGCSLSWELHVYGAGSSGSCSWPTTCICKSTSP